MITTSNRPKVGLTALAVSLLTVLTVFIAGCKNQQKPDEPAIDTSLIGNVDAPSWQSPEEYDMTTSMTAVIKVDFSQSFTAEQLAGIKDKMTDGQIAHQGDLLAAFSGDNCLGVDTLGADQSKLFFLFMTAGNSGATDVQLRYYSTQLKNVFVSKTSFPFSNDEHLGSVAAPHTPTWAIAN